MTYWITDFFNELKNFVYFPACIEKEYYLCGGFRQLEERNDIMTALQLNADIYRNLAVLSEDETMLDKAAKSLRRLVKQMTNDPTCMSKEEYFAKLDRAEQQYARGEYHVMEHNENLTSYMRRMGYDL